MSKGNRKSEKVSIRDVMVQKVSGEWYAFVETERGELFFSRMPRDICPDSDKFNAIEALRNLELILVE